MPDRKLADYRRRLAARRRQYRFAAKRIHALRAAIARRKRQLNPGDAGSKATAFLERRAGWTEKPPGSNDGPFLSNWRRKLNMGWMRGQPYCGFAVLAAYHYAAKKRLPNDTVSTIAIASRARRGDRFRAVPFNETRRGDLVVFHFGSGGPKHVGLARGPQRGGVLKTIEANTSPSNAGSQGNGGGIYFRSRPRGLVHTIARPK